jgi:hypothetical protein
VTVKLAFVWFFFPMKRCFTFTDMFPQKKYNGYGHLVIQI